MIKGAVFYNGVWIAPGSKAHDLHGDKKFDELKKHMKEVDNNERKLRDGKGKDQNPV